MKTTSCNGGQLYAFNSAPRCGARTKRNNGLPCRSPAVRGRRRCRIHGGGKGSGGQAGNTNAVKHGYFNSAMKKLKSEIKDVLHQIKNKEFNQAK
jgi:hypothetical protein